MLKALAIKELRESVAIVAIGALAMLWLLSSEMGWSILPWSSGQIESGTIPFVNTDFAMVLTIIGGALAMGLGLRQTAWENIGNSYYFLLHRPIARNAVFFTKILVGVAILLVLTAVPILVYACWAATPGNHSSPFFWGMTVDAWRICVALPTVYLGAVLSGIRPGRWYGSRLLPLVGVTFTTFVIWNACGIWLGFGLLVALDAVLLALILKSAAVRDY